MYPENKKLDALYRMMKLLLIPNKLDDMHHNVWFHLNAYITFVLIFGLYILFSVAMSILELYLVQMCSTILYTEFLQVSEVLDVHNLVLFFAVQKKNNLVLFS